MGRGIALQFKKRFPANFNAYAQACKAQAVQPGSMFVVENQTSTQPQYIINFPTKRHWRNASRMEDITAGLKHLVQVIRDNHIRSIAIPPLGCGLGGLNWTLVKQQIDVHLAGLEDVRIIVFEPTSTPTADPATLIGTTPHMTPGRAALIVLMQRYLNGLLDPFVTLLEVHKLMYFMQEAGEPLRLTFKKHHYGPYADNLRHVLNTLEGHFISGYGDGGDQPDKQLVLMPCAYEQAAEFLAQHHATQSHFDRVVDLVEGFESPFGLELLSTVHWVVTKEGTATPQAIVPAVHGWNSHKQQFTARQIELAAQHLEYRGWLDANRNALL
jgi:O-acetyl-ADP-ribose deacetylase (regulator of RNase III)